MIAQAHELHADGCRVYAQVSPRPFNINVSFDQTPVFIAIPTWGSLITQSPDEKRRLLRDPAWRADARSDWDKVGDGFTIFPVNRLDRVRLISVRPEEERFLNKTFADVVAARGGHRPTLADCVSTRPRAGHGRGGAVEQRGEGERAIADATTVAYTTPAHLQMMRRR